jgi:hypothetical protein
MTATTVPRTPTRAASTPAAKPWLGRRARRVALITHIVSAGAWIGIDLVLGVLVFTALLTSDTGTEALCYQALELFAVWPLLVAGLATLASGIVLGLGTRYGLVKWTWVFVKLVMNVILVVLVVFLLRPGTADAAEYGAALADGQRLDLDVSGLPFPPIVSGTALVVATVLSVLKPWGRLRKDRSTEATPTPTSTSAD